MISMLREKLAILAQELNANVSYDLTLHTDHPGDAYPNATERHTIMARGYKTKYCMSAGQVMKLKAEDFKKEGESDAGDL